MYIDHEDDLFDLDDDSPESTDLPEGLAGFDMDDEDAEEGDLDDFTIDSTTLITEFDDDEDNPRQSAQGDGDDDQNNEGEPEEQSFDESDLINDLLVAKGIQNNTIQYENENGEIEEVDFYTLPKEEQLAILNSSDKDIDYGLAESEIEAVNFLRENGVSLEETVEYFKRQAVQEYIDSQNIAGIEVDQYTDEELFALDLKAKYEDLTDDEIEIELIKQLEHPELFKKKVDTLRTGYKEIELQELQNTRLQQEQEETRKFTDLQDNLISVAESVEDIGGLDLDIEEKNEVLSYILEKDINGVSPFIKSLDSPQQLFELAWFATKGKEAFAILHDHYKKEIDKVGKASYTRGKEEAAKATPTTPKPAERKSFVRKGNQTTTGKTNTLHIDDLNID